MADAEEKARLLSILEGHGQSFLSSFGIIDDSSKKRRVDGDAQQDMSRKKLRKNEVSDDNEEEEEWFGIGKEAPSEDDSEEEDDEESDSGMQSHHIWGSWLIILQNLNIPTMNSPTVKWNVMLWCFQNLA